MVSGGMLTIEPDVRLHAIERIAIIKAIEARYRNCFVMVPP
jgi:hypothetical protein